MPRRWVKKAFKNKKTPPTPTVEGTGAITKSDADAPKVGSLSQTGKEDGGSVPVGIKCVADSDGNCSNNVDLRVIEGWEGQVALPGVDQTGAEVDLEVFDRSKAEENVASALCLDGKDTEIGAETTVKEGVMEIEALALSPLAKIGADETMSDPKLHTEVEKDGCFGTRNLSPEAALEEFAPRELPEVGGSENVERKLDAAEESTGCDKEFETRITRNYKAEIDDFNQDIQNEEYHHATLSKRRIQKENEIHVSGLHKKVSEGDLIDVFGAFGEIKSARIARKQSTQKSKGFGLISFASREHATKVLEELKDGVEVWGKRAFVAPSLDRNTLYLSNICNTWTKNQVLETLKGLGIKYLKEFLLVDDPENEGKNMGYALLEFDCHTNAVAALQLLKKPDVFFGTIKSARVSITQSIMSPNEDALSQLQAKTVYIGGLPTFWDENKVKDLCKQYGEVESVLLARNIPNKKRKDFGFIDFASNESALAFIRGINTAHLQEGETKLKANLANKPQNKIKLANQSAQTGNIVDENFEASRKAALSETDNQKGCCEVNGNDKAIKLSGAATITKRSKARSKFKSGGQGHKKLQQSSSRTKNRDWKNVDGLQTRQKTEHTPRSKKRKMGTTDANSGQRRKKAHNDHSFGYPPSSEYKSRAYAGPSVTHCSSDLEPHAGYLPARTQRQRHGYVQTSVYDNQPTGDVHFPRYAIGPAPRPFYSTAQLTHPTYSTNHVEYQGGYSYPANGSYTHWPYYY